MWVRCARRPPKTWIVRVPAVTLTVIPRFRRSFGIERGKLDAVVTVDRHDEHVEHLVPSEKPPRRAA